MATGTRAALGRGLAQAAGLFSNAMLTLEQRRMMREQTAREQAIQEVNEEFRRNQLELDRQRLELERARALADLAQSGYQPVGPAPEPAGPFTSAITAPDPVPPSNTPASAPSTTAPPAPPPAASPAPSAQVGTPKPAPSAPDASPPPPAPPAPQPSAAAAAPPTPGPESLPAITFDGRQWVLVPKEPRTYDPATDIPTQRELYFQQNKLGVYRPQATGAGTGGGRQGITYRQALEFVQDQYANTDAAGNILGYHLSPQEMAAAADSVVSGGTLPPLPVSAPEMPPPEPRQQGPGGLFRRAVGAVGRIASGLFDSEPTMASPSGPRGSFDRNDPRNRKMIEILNDPDLTDEQKRFLIAELFGQGTTGTPR